MGTSGHNGGQTTSWLLTFRHTKHIEIYIGALGHRGMGAQGTNGHRDIAARRHMTTGHKGILGEASFFSIL
jgi:hypothetical protein